MDPYAHVSNADGQYIDSLYQDYQQDENSVDPSWQKFFEGFEFALSQNGGGGTASAQAVEDELKVYNFILAYRSRAHLISDTNPIRPRKDRDPRTDLSDHGLTEDDLDRTFAIGSAIGLGSNATLLEIREELEEIYAQSIGVEYMHLNRTELREWVREKFENDKGRRDFDIEEKKRILTKLNEAVVFENFLHTKYVGQKRFSLEGGENTISALDRIINFGSEKGIHEVVLGMAHRGRLNVLANILGKTYSYIFSEFEGDMEPDLTMGDGDVKYHLGFSSQVETEGGKKVTLKLMPNPSHLEAVDPVVSGYTRAKSDHLYEEDYKQILPVLIHGDAALAGQGVVYEVAQMAGLDGYDVGGTIHFVINNQIGFTTNFDDARTSDYCTNVARVTECPVLHVNGDDAEAVVYAVEFAIAYRQKFNKDIYIDMLCYRKHGHNESDDPKITQPKLYSLINNHPDPREVYSKQLVQQGDIEKKMAKEMQKEFKRLLQDRLNMVRQQPLEYEYQPQDEEWRVLRKAKPEDFENSPDTAVTKDDLHKVLEALVKIPDDFKPIRQIEKELEKRQKAIDEGIFDWALGELCAYGTLLLEGNSVRLVGQDTVRGTFSHRHSVLFDAEDNDGYNSLNHIDDNQKKFRVFNSLLSEYAALGFEYGYSLAVPNSLTLWEAQFGDFANGAQNMIDQFISSGASKWQKMTGLVMLLPHGYEGQGPEHSNARPERFLQLAAEYNMILANCTTPANFFHLLRRQLKWEFRKPLVVFSPKQLLRHPKCISQTADFTDKNFKEVIDDKSIKAPTKVKRLVLCSGKIFYDLLERKEEEGRSDIALVRLEQMYPLPETQLEKIIKRYKNADICWVQEEPKNMGAWTFLMRWKTARERFKLISRKASASPATGYGKVHSQEQKELVDKAFDIK